jgi:hypothetical protein
MRSRWMQGHINGLPAIESHGGKVLVKEGFKHDHLISLFKERRKDRVLACMEDL